MQTPLPRTGTAKFDLGTNDEIKLAPRLRVLHIHGVSLQDLPTPFVLRPEINVLGRSTGEGTGARPTIEIPDAHVSLPHAAIRLSGAQVYVRHLKGTNQTWVNDEILQAGVERPLQDGDLLRLGPTAFLMLRFEPMSYEQHECPGLLGASFEMTRLRERLWQASTVGDPVPPVLLLGENGTGKERAALALHRMSDRDDAGRPFIAVNCGAIPDTLIESEFFGHKRGSFSGASADRKGAFAAAHGGTLFLDEIGDLPRAMQVKLLRALEGRKVKALGDEVEREVDVRVIAATNRDLPEEVRSDRFREDLYWRLAKIVIELPPLRWRREDILPLLSHLLGAGGHALPPMHPHLIHWLLSHPWPGNVRALGTVADQLRLHLPAARELMLSHVDLRVLSRAGEPAPAAPAAAPPVPRRRERGAEMPPDSVLRALLLKHRGQLAPVAREINEDRKTLRTYLKRRGLYPLADQSGESGDK